jgi:uncharacterized RDD family membrane protein YckC
MDLYALLGVDPDASKEAIRTAYRDRLDALTEADTGDKVTDQQRAANRSERARLNDAWNVLSDPAQRARYDERRAGGDDASTEVPEIVFDAPPSATGPATREVGGGPLSQRSRRRRIPLAEGVTLADTRPRITAMLIDLAILLILVFAIQQAGQAYIRSHYPAETHRIEVDQRARTKASEALTKATDARKEAERQVKAAKGADARARAKADLADAQQAERDAIKADTAAADRLAKSQQRLQGPGVAILVANGLVGLLVLVPATALTGRTLGMRLRGVRVIRADGDPVGWLGAAARYLLPIVVVTGLFYSLPGLLLGLGSVLFWLWDPNRQGFHDRLARTLVVAAPVSKRP